jgi:hypothetical protein
MWTRHALAYLQTAEVQVNFGGSAKLRAKVQIIKDQGYMDGKIFEVNVTTYKPEGLLFSKRYADMNQAKQVYDDLCKVSIDTLPF